ncbi:VanZ family protein [Chitinimonas koreensis]|uniref:VanZ family protein n=1 Tax=Chitinimonas koreensis TaxID=356302 RepID=UPI000421AC47|nr:VanZ family protein [Chitinimonas koreensis]QNM95035.1 VanZ family protein [Chitinimonas koreensis]
MPILLHPRLAQAAALLATLIVAYASLMHNPPLPEVPQSDKWAHLLGYACLASAWLLALPRHRLALVLGAIGYGILIECLQGLTDYRSFDPLDMLANGAGCLIGLALSWPLGRIVRVRRSD